MKHASSRIGILRLALGGACLLAAPFLAGAESDAIAVYSKVSPDYHRVLLPDGKPQAEAYAFGEGGDMGGAISDATIDRMRFADIAQLIAPALAKEAYVPAELRAPAQARLLIMVYWGTTIGTDGTSSSAQYQIAQSLIPPARAGMSLPPTGGSAAMVSDPTTSGRGAEGQVAAALKGADDSAQQQSLMLTTMANRQRDKQNLANANVLGFQDEMKRVATYDSPAFARKRQDVIEQVEEARYYVVLLAYDFPLLADHHEKKLLWETRFSIPQRRNDFGRQLAAMAESAARYFGQDSGGLVRKRLHDGRVDMEEIKILGDVPEKK